MKEKNGVPLDPAKFRLADAPGYLVRRCQQRAVELYVQEVGDDGPTPHQFTALVSVWQNPGINQTGLVNITAIDRSTMGELLSRLVRRGWLRRRRTTTDGRSNALYLTAAGSAIVEESLPKIAAAQNKILAPIPPDRRDEFLSYLRLVADSPIRDGTDPNTGSE
jgi:DNA-binding MarR family transcriptional regulator